MVRFVLVLESPWEDEKSYSVWPFVEGFSRASEIEASYRSFFDSASFKHWIDVFRKHKRGRSGNLLYVAAHGSKGRIEGLGKSINKNTVVDTLKKARSFQYVHFGSCLFGQESNLEELLKTCRHIKWAAGYEKEVPWIQSTLFDILFWERIRIRERDEEGRKFFTIVSDFIEKHSAWINEFGFRFAYRYGKEISCLPKA